ncbi:MAG: hypothetical protein R8L07_03555 [Alphaproteobacteria bacterium]|nr:hypothetical protein [Alphaproteobacteria bacterium]
MTGHTDNGRGGLPVGPLGRPAYGLTAGQRDCLAVIQELTAVDGRCPSYAEIAREMDLPRRSAVKGLVDGLIERGWLSRVPGRRRSLVPLLTLRLPDGADRPVAGLTDRGRAAAEGRAA